MNNLINTYRRRILKAALLRHQRKTGSKRTVSMIGGFDTAVIYSGQHGSISVYPAPERFALASHVEGLAIEKYGQELGQQMALRMYRDMLDTDAENGLQLSKMGREGFNLLHDSFIEQIQKEGMPDKPVMH